MQSLRNYLGTAQDDGPSSSVLAEWNKYANGGGDVETGSSLSSDPARNGGDTASAILTAGLAGAKFMQSTLSSSVSRAAANVSEGASTVSSGVSKVGETVSASMPAMPDGFQVPSTQQLTYFMAFMGGGIFFLIISFTIALPVIVLAPSKFAFSFTMGCGLIMSAFASLKGWKAQVAHMMQKERLPFSIGYVSSMLGTLYAAMVMHSYILSIICSGAQVVALLYYVMSYFPGGAAGVRVLLNMMYRAVSGCFTTGTRAILG